ncbi:protein SEH1-like [Cannabis sativa]|uniref:protein SEH1-like n=1 Tax=Cannabis sativa TaxID=3483 RepID=UPI0029C9F156|nr:protein SEH1-like [Cannabis sativa]
MVAAYSDGHIKVYELLDPLELKNWQLQAEFQNVSDSVSILSKASCMSASISWNPPKGESQELSFVLGFNSDTPQLNSSKEDGERSWIKFVIRLWRRRRKRLLHRHRSPLSQGEASRKRRNGARVSKRRRLTTWFSSTRQLMTSF